MNTLIKFRIWDKQNNKFVHNDSSLHCQSNWVVDAFTGEIADFVRAIDGDYGSETYTKDPNPDCYAQGTKIIREPRYTLWQFTGIIDKNGKDIFEGDIVQFQYQPQDLNRNNPQNSTAPITLVGRVIKDKTTTNLCLEVAEPCGMTYYPLGHAEGKTTEIVGNTLQKQKA
jgi:hypothetical protein